MSPKLGLRLSPNLFFALRVLRLGQHEGYRPYRIRIMVHKSQYDSTITQNKRKINSGDMSQLRQNCREGPAPTSSHNRSRAPVTSVRTTRHIDMVCDYVVTGYSHSTPFVPLLSNTAQSSADRRLITDVYI